MKRKILYYYQTHCGNWVPSLKTIWFKWIYICSHVPGLNIWALELKFKNASVGIGLTSKPYALLHGPGKENFLRIGCLDSITLRLGKPFVTINFTKRWNKCYLENIEKDQIPLDWYSLKAVDNSYSLYINYCRADFGKIEKFGEPKMVANYEQKPTQDEIFRQIMLNDFSRWNTRLGNDDSCEISEYVYDYLLNVLPPRKWDGNYFEVGEADYHDNNGRAIHRACIQKDDRYYTGHPDKIRKIYYNKTQA